MAVAAQERQASAELVDLETTPLRELNQRLHELARAPGPSGLAHRQPERRARRRLRRWTRTSRSRSRVTSATTAPG